ncbi:MAG: efflux RND transporter periplasmic adaptor subunit [Pseudomonadota bacterium]
MSTNPQRKLTDNATSAPEPGITRPIPVSRDPVNIPGELDQSADSATNPGVTPARFSREFFLPAAGALLFVAVLATAASWWFFHSGHVVTRNALVRSHLSELGVRGEGVIAEIVVNAGDIVRKGDLLARLDDTHLHAQRAQFKARIATLDERIAVDETALAFAREESQARLVQAEAEVQRKLAEADAARLRSEDAAAFHAARKPLQRDGAISAEALRDAAARAAMQASLAEAARAAAAGASAELDAARLAVDALQLREGELRVLRAKRWELLAGLSGVEADIESSRILAPADGAVVRRLTQPGMAVQTGTPILSLWLTAETWVEAWVPEEHLADLQVGGDVSVSFPAMPGERFTGVVERVGLATDFEMPLDYLPQTRETRMRPTPQVGVLVRLDSEHELIRPGMSAVVDIRRGGV